MPRTPHQQTIETTKGDHNTEEPCCSLQEKTRHGNATSYNQRREEPSYHKQLPIPAVHLHFINEQINKLLSLGAIREDLVSPHNLPVFAVKRPHSNELRFVIDMKKVNKIKCDDFHNFMDVNKCLQLPVGIQAKLFTALDLVNAHWQLEETKESQEYTAFTVPGRGKFV